MNGRQTNERVGAYAYVAWTPFCLVEQSDDSACRFLQWTQCKNRHKDRCRAGSRTPGDDLRGPDSNINCAKTFVFLDACFSGGIREELVAAVPCIFGTSTCTEDGFSYDSSSVGHGAWTAQFLCEGLIKLRYREHKNDEQNDVDLFELYLKSRTAYVRKYPRRGDRP